MILLFLAACTQEGPTPDSLLPLLDDPVAMEKMLQTESDPIQKDILLLQLAVRSPKHAQQLCKKIQTDNAKEKCRQIIGRPHLGGH